MASPKAVIGGLCILEKHTNPDDFQFIESSTDLLIVGVHPAVDWKLSTHERACLRELGWHEDGGAWCLRL